MREIGFPAGSSNSHSSFGTSGKRGHTSPQPIDMIKSGFPWLATTASMVLGSRNAISISFAHDFNHELVDLLSWRTARAYSFYPVPGMELGKGARHPGCGRRFQCRQKGLSSYPKKGVQGPWPFLLHPQGPLDALLYLQPLRSVYKPGSHQSSRQPRQKSTLR